MWQHGKHRPANLTMLGTMMSEQSLGSELEEEIGKMFDLTDPVIQDRYLEAAPCEGGQLEVFVAGWKMYHEWRMYLMMMGFQSPC